LWKPSYPDWLNRDFETRLNLPERLERLNATAPHVHSRRPEAYQILTDHFWADLFESYDPGVTYFPIESRHPLFDLRLVNYLMALPTLPVCVNKRLMREAMRGLLPEQVLNRSKAPVAGDPILDRLRNCSSRLRGEFDPASRISEYVDLSRYANDEWAARLRSSLEIGSDLASLEMRPLSLNYWLKCQEPTLKQFRTD
jgi:asparagine synthase (glutamine-hydrolysing)